MAKWLYAQDGQMNGPKTESEILSLFLKGKINSDTFVSSDDISDWTPLFDVEGLIPPENCSLNVDKIKTAKEANQIRPVDRFFARYFDLMLLVAIIVNTPFGDAMNSLSDATNFWLALLIVFLTVFIEATMISLWGATPGKAIIGVTVLRHDGDKLSYSEALKRSIRVWFQGQGCLIPIIREIANYIEYRNLKRQGTTSWDKAENFVVLHKNLGLGRVVLIFAFIFACVIAVGGYKHTTTVFDGNGKIISQESKPFWELIP